MKYWHLKTKLPLIVFKQFASTSKYNHLIYFRKIIDIYSENHKKPTNTLYDHSAELLIVKADGTRPYRRTLKG